MACSHSHLFKKKSIVQCQTCFTHFLDLLLRTQLKQKKCRTPKCNSSDEHLFCGFWDVGFLWKWIFCKQMVDSLIKAKERNWRAYQVYRWTLKQSSRAENIVSKGYRSCASRYTILPVGLCPIYYSALPPKTIHDRRVLWTGESLVICIKLKLKYCQHKA